MKLDNEVMWLWFDVGIKRYTTLERFLRIVSGCGLM